MVIKNVYYGRWVHKMYTLLYKLLLPFHLILLLALLFVSYETFCMMTKVLPSDLSSLSAYQVMTYTISVDFYANIHAHCGKLEANLEEAAECDLK